jgi:hypothetical protein
MYNPLSAAPLRNLARQTLVAMCIGDVLMKLLKNHAGRSMTKVHHFV